MSDVDRRKTFHTATKVHAKDGEVFGMTREEVARSMLGQSIFLHTDTFGHDKTIASLERYIKFIESERDAPFGE